MVTKQKLSFLWGNVYTVCVSTGVRKNNNTEEIAVVIYCTSYDRQNFL